MTASSFQKILLCKSSQLELCCIHNHVLPDSHFSCFPALMKFDRGGLDHKSKYEKLGNHTLSVGHDGLCGQQ
jgi:hypothetical protein